MRLVVPPSGGSLEIGNLGIPSWKEIGNREKIRVKPVLLGRGQAALLVLRPLLEG